jgi:hypothetical protein
VLDARVVRERRRLAGVEVGREAADDRQPAGGLAAGLADELLARVERDAGLQLDDVGRGRRRLRGRRPEGGRERGDQGREEPQARARRGETIRVQG